jgi:uncharacterized protein (DUF39 family)
LRSGEIELKGKHIPTSSLSSLYKARQISQILKSQIQKGAFMIEKPVQNLAMDRVFKALDVRTEKEAM